MVDIWRLINERRMERFGWSSSGPNAEQGSLRPGLSVFRTIAERNHARGRRRYLCARYLISQDDILDVWEDDVHQVDPLDVEGVSVDSQEVNLNLPTLTPPRVQPVQPVPPPSPYPCPAWALAIQSSP